MRDGAAPRALRPTGTVRPQIVEGPWESQGESPGESPGDGSEQTGAAAAAPVQAGSGVANFRPIRRSVALTTEASSSPQSGTSR